MEWLIWAGLFLGVLVLTRILARGRSARDDATPLQQTGVRGEHLEDRLDDARKT